MTIRSIGGRDLESFDPALIGADFCPVCGNRGIPVTRLVIRATLAREFHGGFSRDGFSFCPTPSCPLAYFDNEQSEYVQKEELRVLVGRKTAGPSAPVCYCFRVTEARVIEEVAVKGCCRTLDEFAQATGVLLGKACHVVNPSGQCCRPEVKATVVKALTLVRFSQASPEVQGVLAENVDHCRARCALGASTITERGAQ